MEHGCSNGAEAYSLAMTVAETEGTTGMTVSVLGTDLAESVLHQAENGVYSKREVGAIPNDFLDRYFEPVTINNALGYQVGQGLCEMTRFEVLNLIDADWSGTSRQDVIFCQNVLIYFDNETRSRVARRLYEQLKPGGWLFLGPADAVGLEISGVLPLRMNEAIVYGAPEAADSNVGGVN